MDKITKKKRSWNMSRIKALDTRPERLFRSYMHKLGFRYSLNKKNLPGKPDLYLKKYNTAIFINGCFWHRHRKCKYASMPKSNKKFWAAKLEGNANRDKINYATLQKSGYKIIIIWECEISENKNAKINTRKLNKKISRLIYEKYRKI